MLISRLCTFPLKRVEGMAGDQTGDPLASVQCGCVQGLIRDNLDTLFRILVAELRNSIKQRTCAQHRLSTLQSYSHKTTVCCLPRNLVVRTVFSMHCTKGHQPRELLTLPSPGITSAATAAELLQAAKPNLTKRLFKDWDITAAFSLAYPPERAMETGTPACVEYFRDGSCQCGRAD